MRKTQLGRCGDKNREYVRLRLRRGTFTLEEFLEKFPYKVGDKVKVCSDNLGVIISMRWKIDCVVYKVKLSKNGYETSKTSENLQPYKEETMDKVSKAVFDANAQCCDITNRLINEETMEEKSEQITVDIPNGYEFFGIDDNNKIVLTKKQLQYPKTYKECCEVLMGKTDFQDYSLLLTKLSTKINEANSISPEPPHITLINNFYKLLICRDAYWKIAGEQMGLGKPWKPNWTNNYQKKWTIGFYQGEINLTTGPNAHYVLAFPTAEIRDFFYEKFKDLIELVKELL